MELIQLHYPHDLKIDELPPLAMALGYFDGVHIGHQRVILEVKKEAEQKGLKSAVMTFDPHPSVVLGRSVRHIEYITPLAEKIRIMEEMAIDYLFVVHFTSEFANLLPQEFVDQYVIGLNVKHLAAGFDFTYGRMGKGTMETVPFHSRGSFSVTVIPKMTYGDEKISSTRIRQLIQEGKTEELPDLLGRFYTIAGTVIHGDKRGRTIGFPTANVDAGDDYIVPPLGVYAVRLKVEGSWFNGVCNIGHRPTFKNEQEKKPSIEVHLFDFNRDIYGQEVVVEWHIYLRAEQKFSGIDSLIAQIGKDKEAALDYFKEDN